jgi:hypothetical protein
MTKKYTVPNRENDNNYMLDTSAYNHVIISAKKMNIVKKSVSYGFCYYSTALQDTELSGKGAKTYNGECISETVYIPIPEFKQKIDIVNKELDVHLVPEIASCMRDHSRLDGTVRFLAPDNIEGQIYKEIINKNKINGKRPFEHSYDAMIAEAAIHYGCIVISDDKPLRDVVNSYFSDRAITTDKLLEIINKYKADV